MCCQCLQSCALAYKKDAFAIVEKKKSWGENEAKKKRNLEDGLNRNISVAPMCWTLH